MVSAWPKFEISLQASSGGACRALAAQPNEFAQARRRRIAARGNNRE
jgi:hypothetical protein